MYYVYTVYVYIRAAKYTGIYTEIRRLDDVQPYSSLTPFIMYFLVFIWYTMSDISEYRNSIIYSDIM